MQAHIFSFCLCITFFKCIKHIMCVHVFLEGLCSPIKNKKILKNSKHALNGNTYHSRAT